MSAPTPTAELLQLAHLSVLELEPDDVLVLTLPWRLTQAAHAELQDRVERLLREAGHQNQLLLLHGGAQLAVARSTA